jgi:two-component sensor histidine kinase
VRTRSGQWYILRILPYRSVDGANDGVVLTFVDITERKRSEYELRLLLRELDHRVKNTLAAVQSIAEESARSAGSLPDFVEAFRARIDALARLHTLLTTREARTVALRQVVETTVAPFCRGPGSLRVEGEAPPLPAATARSVGMALNELALNAVKYGALSTPEGQVTLSCDAVPRPEGSGLRIVWRESGGPSVVPPSRRGFGSVLIEEAIPYELGGETTLAFPADGVRCEIVIPAAQLAQER